MIDDLPLVSVVMPNYNTPEIFLRTAIESILAQTYQNIEFIIVDDASTENDVKIIKSYHDNRIILLQNEHNQHVSYSLNRGFAVAKGEYIVRMDSDDISLPQRIEKQVRFMQKRPDIDILSAQAEIFGVREGIFATKLQNTMAMKIATFFNCSIINPSVMIKASFLRENALTFRVDLEYKAAEDYEFWSRCVSIGHFYEYPQILLKYRIHSKQISSASSTMQIESANRVRKNMLKSLAIVPSWRETDIHYIFSTETTPQGDIPLQEIESWAIRLIEANERTGIFCPRLFKQKVIQHFFIIAVKSLIQKQISLGQAFKCRLMVKALSPRYYSDYIRRILFSKRLNRAL